ncbi:Oidioi.mRNA.OKI2018_I69.XSR.g13400.t1.cds [Oikopleura dioica]|uniref:Ribonuclease n=1 Tax=Oikopleura dioica TaxID=34765 RepID=A0ABN7S8H2_OIKDI|nr:Oidioi.mRNA.OKI2018_I69.XSR.g13400.t1.cds [Oikopleura dioica]
MELDKLLFQTAPFNAPQPDTTAKSSNPSQVQNQHHPSQNSNARYCNMQSLPNGNPSHIQQQPPIVSMANSHYDHSHTQNLQQLASGTRDYLLQNYEITSAQVFSAIIGNLSFNLHQKNAAEKESRQKGKDGASEKLEALDDEDFIPESGSNTQVADSLELQLFDFVPDGLDKSEEYCLGIDEAGRGPVNGPMVYSAAFCVISEHQKVRDDIGANDSKQLEEIDRERMLKSIDKCKWVGYTGVVLPPAYISKSMLRRAKYNLNEMSHDTAISMIRRVLDHHKVNVKEVFVDTVGKPEKYQEKLLRFFPQLSIRVESKADATYPIVGAASIVAKVTRDKLVHNWDHVEPAVDKSIEVGSGYPGDPKTKNWIRQHLDHVFGLPTYARLSWGTATEAMAKNCAEVEWEHEFENEEEEANQKARKRGIDREVVGAGPTRKCAFFRENNIHRVSLWKSKNAESFTA